MKNNKIYIILFIILYVFVALVSGIHGFAFFGLANTPLLAIMLAIAFEIGQAAVLFSILTDSSQRKNERDLELDRLTLILDPVTY